MAAAAGIWNQPQASAQAQIAGDASPKANAATSTSASGTSVSIGANDFLTLLVAEMRNQDPTATSDPNQYINQLVQVNSLEQLISINENLSTALKGSPTKYAIGSPSNQAIQSTSDLTAKSGPTAQAQSAGRKVAASPAQLAVTSANNAGIPAPHSGAIQHAAGNLSIPEGRPAAHRVAQSLGGRPHPVQ